jgi:hypothetical protein
MDIKNLEWIQKQKISHFYHDDGFNFENFEKNQVFI